MVGVAGKSQGCNTCRKRKVKCDEERPTCGQCKRKNRPCGGYQRDLHFRNLSALDHDALLKRAQPLVPLTQSSTISYQNVVSEGVDQEPKRVTSHTMNLDELFFYLPQVSWLQALAPLQGTSSSLDMAMSALKMVRLSRQNNNEKLRREGLANYGKALEGLHKILSNPDLVFEEQTLAASMTLSIFEVLEVSGEDTYGWISHIEGTLRLFQLRGPDMHVSGSGHMLFQGFRPTGIAFALATRKATYLAEQEWISIPWTTMPKSDFHCLLDIMTKITALVETTERMTRDRNTNENDLQKGECLKQCRMIHDELKDFYVHLQTKSSKPLFTESPATSFCTTPCVELESVIPISLHFPTFEIARTSLFYWSALLWIYDTIFILRPSEPSLLENSLAIATRIAQSIEYLLSPGMHTRGPQNIFSPLRLAQHAFSKKSADGREVRWCRSVFDEVDARGYPFGKIVSNCEWDDIPALLTRGGNFKTRI